VLKSNCLSWWKRKQDFEAGEGPWGYLDFHAIPPHIVAKGEKEVTVEMPGRNYRMYCDPMERTKVFIEALEAQESNTRARILRDQGDAMEQDLHAATLGFKSTD